tara:strand:- start:1477 stop:1713 length:237 start_codon:yes stop_codon:yes gene_type:complete
MPQKNLTQIKVGALGTIADTLTHAADGIRALAETANDLGAETIEVSHMANTTEAVRRVQVFASAVEQALFELKISKDT